MSNSGSTGIMTESDIHASTFSALSQIPGYHFKSTVIPSLAHGENVEMISGYRISGRLPVIAKVSPTSLRLEREFYTMKRLYHYTDGPHFVVRPLEYLYLPTGVTVTIYADDGNCEQQQLQQQQHTNTDEPAAKFPEIDPFLSMKGCDDYEASSSWPLPEHGRAKYRVPNYVIHSRIAAPVYDIRTFLRFAIQCTDALDFIHRHGIVHNEIRLTAFQWSGEDNERVRLWNFGSGSKSLEPYLTSEGWRKTAYKKESMRILEDMLVFMSPEQTGRTTFLPDHRSDIYSLGIVFFVLLTGRYPFAGGPLEILNGVLSRKMVMAHEFQPTVPEILSHIIEKMTHKAPDDRYNSAHGVRTDLKRCLEQLLAADCTSAEITPFPLGRDDIVSVFTLSKNLYGRQNMVAEMIHIIERCAGVQKSSNHRSHDKSSLATPSIQNTVPGSTGDEFSEFSGRDHWTRELAESQSVSSIPEGSEVSSVTSRGFSKHNKQYVTFVAVYGQGGSGKSSLFNAVQATARQNGYIAVVKFDMRHKVPYGRILQSLSQILQQVLSEPEDEVRSFYWHMQTHLGSLFCNIDLLADLVPELKPLKNPAIPEEEPMETVQLDNVEAQARFHNLFIEVFRAITQWRMTTLFLDDLHVADEPSLELIEALMTSRVKLLIFGAYRDNEVSDKLAKILDNDQVRTHYFPVENLSIDSLANLVCDTLHRSRENSRDYILPLVEIIHQKTRGNPFYVAQLLKTLEKKKLIFFDWERNEWDYNFAEIQEATMLANHMDANATLDVSFLVARLRELPKQGQALLKWASYVGDTFSWNTVKNLVLASEASDTDSDFSDASTETERQKHVSSEIDDELNVAYDLASLQLSNPISSFHSESSSSYGNPQYAYRKRPRDMDSGSPANQDLIYGLHAVVQEGYILPLDSDEFKWSHDRISQAAMELADPKMRGRIHLRIARYLMRENNTDVFLIADHLLKCLPLIKSLEDKESYLRVLVDAGDKGRFSGAHKMAFAYYMAAIRTMDTDAAWRNDYDTTLHIFTSAVSVSWVVSEYEETDALLEAIFCYTTDPLHRVTAYRIQAKYYAARQMHAEGKVSLYRCLYELGMSHREFEVSKTQFRNEYAIIRHMLDEMGVEYISMRPVCQDVRLKAIMTVLEELCTVEYWLGNLDLLNYWACRVANLSLTHGLTSASGVTLVFLGMAAVTAFKDYKFGEAVGAQGVAICERYGGNYEKGRAAFLYASFLLIWKHHYRETHSWFRTGYRLSLAGGDRIYASLSQLHIAASGWYCGHHLADVLEIAETCYKDTHAWSSNADTNVLVMGIIRSIKSMQGHTYGDTTRVFDGDDGFCDEHFVADVTAKSSNPAVPLNFYNAFKALVLMLFGHYEEAVKVGNACVDTIELNPCHRHTRGVLFVHSMSMIETIRMNPEMPKEQRKRYLDKVQKNQALIYDWVENSRINYVQWWTIVEAERASLGPSVDFARAAALFEDAINQAREGGWFMEMCLAHEYAGRFYQQQGINNVAYTMIRKSIELHMKYGSYGVARSISQRYRDLLSMYNDSYKERIDTGVQTDPFPFMRSHEDWTTMSFGQSPALMNEPYTSQSIPPVTTEQSLLTLDILDMTSILKSSQVISSEIKFDSLLKSMMNIILDNSGADCGAIIVTDEKYGVCAYGSQEDGFVTFNPPLELSESDDRISSRIINHTIHTMESIFVQDVQQDGRFAVGPWFERAGKKSVICMPITHKGTLVGCLFLEGPVGIFSQRHITVLSLLCQQMGISISNAYLFKSVQTVMRSNMEMIEVQKQALEEARKSKEAAIKATRLREIFLANMSHEIRTPFSGFYGMISLLADTDLDPEQRDLVRTAKESCEILLRIIDDLLNFSKLQAGKVVLDLSPVVIEDLVADVVETLIAMAIQKRLNITYTVAPDVPSVVIADENRLRQIIINLLGNAIKFTHQGEINIRCSLDKNTIVEDDEKVAILFEIIDTGIGIREDQRKALFAPFSQVDGSTTRMYGGTGLGLSICLQLVQLMSGKIDVISSADKGSTFYFTIQVSRAQQEMAQRDNTVAALYRGLENTPVLAVAKQTSTIQMLRNLMPSMILDGIHSPEALVSLKDKHYSVIIVGLNLNFDEEVDTWSRYLQPFVDRASCVVQMHYPSSSVGHVMGKPLVSSPSAIRMAVPLRRQKLHLALMDMLHHIQPATPQPLRQNNSITAEERAIFQNLHILVAEDNPVAQKLLYKQLTRLGFQVTCANNGLEAVERWEGRREGFFCMAFFDHHMPKCDGVEATKRIREIERNQQHRKRFPIIALTADVQDSARVICMEAGMDAYLTKPLNQKVLTETIRQHCVAQTP